MPAGLEAQRDSNRPLRASRDRCRRRCRNRNLRCVPPPICADTGNVATVSSVDAEATSEKRARTRAGNLCAF